MTIKTAGMADIACLLLGDRLLMREREIDLLNYPFGILEGEPVSLGPADRLGVREGRPSIVGAVSVVPDAHGALPEVRCHHARLELLDFIRMTVRLSAGLFRKSRIVAKCSQIAVMIEKRSDIIV